MRKEVENLQAASRLQNSPSHPFSAGAVEVIPCTESIIFFSVYWRLFLVIISFIAAFAQVLYVLVRLL